MKEKLYWHELTDEHIKKLISQKKTIGYVFCDGKFNIVNEAIMVLSKKKYEKKAREISNIPKKYKLIKVKISKV